MIGIDNTHSSSASRPPMRWRLLLSKTALKDSCSARSLSLNTLCLFISPECAAARASSSGKGFVFCKSSIKLEIYQKKQIQSCCFLCSRCPSLFYGRIMNAVILTRDLSANRSSQMTHQVVTSAWTND